VDKDVKTQKGQIMNDRENRVVIDSLYYRVEEPSYSYGYVPALKLTLFNAVTDEYMDDIYVFCLRGYDLRATKNKDLSGRSEGMSSGISLYTPRDGVIERVAETVEGYLKHPDTVKAHGHKMLWGMRGRGISSLLDDPEIIKFADDTIEFVASIRKEDYRLKRC
jgi:hypothetical protein